jgi:hypothetical protein
MSLHEPSIVIHERGDRGNRARPEALHEIASPAQGRRLIFAVEGR